MKDLAVVNITKGLVCGVQPVLENNKEWKVGCEYDSNDKQDSFEMTLSSAFECARKCHEHQSTCTSYSWSWNGTEGMCQLHSGNKSQAFLVNSDYYVCGTRPTLTDNGTYPNVGKMAPILMWVRYCGSGKVKISLKYDLEK